jgi:lysophospholipase L1-like esterase
MFGTYKQGQPFAGSNAGRVMLLGDSLIQNHTANTTGGSSFANTTTVHQRGFFNWFQSLYNFPFSYESINRGLTSFTNIHGTATNTAFAGDNKGVTGDDTYDVLARLQKDIIAEQPDIVYITLGTNDINAGRTVNGIYTNMLRIIELVLASGAVVWINTVFPRHNSTGIGFTAPQEAVRLALNTRIMDLPRLYPGRVYAIECDSFLIDTNTGLLNTAYSYDGVHLGSSGAAMVAENGIANQIWKKISQGRKPRRDMPENFDATLVPYGNILPNADFSATGGTIGTGASGTVPGSYTLSRAAGTTATVAGSIVTQPDINGDAANFARLDLAVNATGLDDETIRLATTSNITTNIALGDYVYAEVEVIVETTGTTNPLRSVYLNAQDNTTNATGPKGDCMRMDGVRFTQASVKDLFPNNKKYHRIMRTPVFQLAGTTGISVRLNADLDGTVTGTRTIYFGRPKLVKSSARTEELMQINNIETIYGFDWQVRIPAGAVIDSICFQNQTANAVTGGIRIGTTAGGADVVAAQAVGASAIGHVADSAILKRFFSFTSPQILHVSAVTAWNSASVKFKISWKV